MALLVLILTTAAEAFWAASLKLPGGTSVGLDAGDSKMEMAPWFEPVCPSHCGLSVATTKYAASSTVQD